MANYFVLSNFGVRYFISDYTSVGAVPAVGKIENEIQDVLSCDIGAFTKETTKYRTLNSNGWESIASLGNTAEDATFECVRGGDGNVYDGDADSGDTYSKIKHWFLAATKSAGVSSPKCIVEIVPRGDNEYEGTCYYVVPNKWTPGTKDPEKGQEYSFTVSLFGPPTVLKVTHTPASGETAESFSFTAVE